MAMEMVDYTFKKTKFTKFHPADGDRRNKRFSKITDSCSRRLMQAIVQKLKFQLNIISTQKCHAYRRFQSNSTPTEYHQATTLISEVNSRVHWVIKEAKDAKFATLLKEVTPKCSTNHCDASLGKRTGHNPRRSRFKQCRAVRPQQGSHVCTHSKINKTDEYQVKADCEKFFRRLRLKAHFHDSKNEHHEEDNHHDPFTKIDLKTSTWNPPDGKFSALDHYIDRCRQSIASRNYRRRPNFSNLTQEEKTALQDLRWRNDIIINQRTKVVLWLSGNVISTFRRQTSSCRTTVFTNVWMLTPFSKITKSSRTPLGT